MEFPELELATINMQKLYIISLVMLRIPFRSDNVEERWIFFIDLINLQSPRIFWSERKIDDYKKK